MQPIFVLPLDERACLFDLEASISARLRPRMTGFLPKYELFPTEFLTGIPSKKITNETRNKRSPSQLFLRVISPCIQKEALLLLLSSRMSTFILYLVPK